MTPGAHWRDALRLIRRSPRELPAIVLVLSIAIGALASAYVVIDAVVFKPLPFPRPESLVRVWNAAAPSGQRGLSGRELALLNVESTRFAGGAPYVPTTGHIRARRDSDAVRLRGIVTTPRLFTVLGVSPASQWVDRLDEPRPSGMLPIVVSERLRARGIVQGTAAERLYVDGVVHEVIAIMPAAFWFPDPTVDYWVPALSDVSLSSGWSGPVIARLVADTTPRTAQAVLRGMAAGNNRSLELIVREWRLDQLEPVRPMLASIQQVVGLLTLLALLNLSWVLAARARRFERQSAIMGALGAPAHVLVLGRLWEAILFAVASVPPAMVVAWVVVKGLALRGAAFVPRLAEARLTHSALLVAAVAGLIIASAASVPGLLLTAHASRRHDLLQRVKTVPRPRTELLTMTLQVAVVAAIATQALALVLGLRALLAENVGFDRTDTVVVAFQAARGHEPHATIQQMSELTERLAANGVRTAFTSAHPLSGRDILVNASRTRDEKLSGTATMVGLRAVTADYFQLVGVPVKTGRAFTARDENTGTIVLNETLARQVLGSIDVAGRTIHLGEHDLTVIGVVKATRHRSLSEAPRPEAYVLYGDVGRDVPPAARMASSQFYLVVRDGSRWEDVVRRIHLASEDTMPGARITAAAPLRNLVLEAAGERPLVMLAVSAVGALALFLIAAGCYGMLAQSVARRARENAIRVSLGATRGRIARESLWPAAIVWAVGCALGYVLFFTVERTVGIIGGVVPSPGSSTVSWGLSAALLLVVMLAASMRPIWTAATASPALALRSE